MITNFDNETSPLNELELKAANVIKAALIHGHVGESKAVTNETMLSGLSTMKIFQKENGKPALNTARIRKIISYLRTEESMMIVSNSKGYYIADKPSQIRDCIRSLRERAEAIKHVADSMLRSFREQFSDDPLAQMAI